VRFTTLLLLLTLLANSLSGNELPDLRLESVRESLTGTHYRYRQYVAGRPVAGGGTVVTITKDGSRLEESSLARLAGPAPQGLSRGTTVLNDGGVARFVDRSIAHRRTLEPVAEYHDALTGELIREEPLYYNAKEGRVFKVNPVVALNAPELRDQNDAATAVPEAAYSAVTLRDLAESGPLRGPWVEIRDLEPNANPQVDAAGSLSFNRADDGFEEVNTYYHVDRAQRYLQELGYRGVRGVVPYAIEADPHGAGGADNSYYISGAIPGRGTLIFGDGGTDDAEDSDLIVHEYLHAIQDWIAPAVFGGTFISESRALGEAAGDYWAFSAKYEQARSSGRDPYCFADWDARCWTDEPSEVCAYRPDSNCLRRVDGTKSMTDYISTNAPGSEHRNGEIMSSALREILESLVLRFGTNEGHRRADTIVIESMFGTAPNPTFASFARRLLLADRLLYGGASADVICAAMSFRGIVVDCGFSSPRGEETWFVPTQVNIPIPDFNSAGIVSTIVIDDSRPIASVNVHVDLDHPFRGDLKITLVAPDGTEVILMEPSTDRAADLFGTFGRDIVPLQPLTVLRGKSARGQWQLRVADLRMRDAGVLVSWSLALRFEGELPATSRPAIPADERQTIPIAGSVIGVNGSRFISNLKLTNPGVVEKIVDVIFTPSGADGRTAFSAVRVRVAAGESITISDVVATLFRGAGTGQLEIGGGVGVSSEIVATTDSGSFTQAVSAFTLGDASRNVSPVVVGPLPRTLEFRSNAGLAEVSGNAGLIEIAFYGAGGTLLDTRVYPIAPFSHVQFPVDRCIDCSVIVEMRVISGVASIVAYGSIVENSTGRATFVRGVPGPVLFQSRAATRRTRDDLDRAFAPPRWNPYSSPP